MIDSDEDLQDKDFWLADREQESPSDRNYWVEEFNFARFDGFSRVVAFILTFYLFINDLFNLAKNIYYFNTHD